MPSTASHSGARTSLTVWSVGQTRCELIEGARFPWRFRPHMHAGDEVVHILAGRARLRLPGHFRDVEAGEKITVPSHTIHRFEPVDREGWAFASEFRNDCTAGAQASTVAGGRLSAQVRSLLASRASLHTDIAAMADACGVSAGYLGRAFRREVGVSLHNYHVLVAVHEAKTQLKNGLSIVDAALGSGFYDQAHLTREFVKTFGMTPGTFRFAWTRTSPSAPLRAWN